jgi:hypothetical protein
MRGQRWLLAAYVLLTILYVLPAFGVFNQLTAIGLPFNIVWMVAILATFVLLSIVWYALPQTRKIFKEMDEENAK